MTDGEPSAGRLDWIVDGLVQAGEKVDPQLRQRILAAAGAAVPTLLSVLTDEALHAENGPGAGWAPISAAVLLGEMRAEAAVEPLLDVLGETDELDVIGDRAIAALRAVGRPALEPALARNAAAETDEASGRLLAVLAGLGVRDERILALLVAQTDWDLFAATLNLADYGDPRALPHLSAVLDTIVLEDLDGPWADQVFIELREAIEALGGEFTAAQEEKARRAVELRRQWYERRTLALRGRTPHVAPDKPGRNDRCRCGSGAKYKRCCLRKDEEARREGRGPGAET